MLSLVEHEKSFINLGPGCMDLQAELNFCWAHAIKVHFLMLMT